jgi:hypothetical protein
VLKGEIKALAIKIFKKEKIYYKFTTDVTNVFVAQSFADLMYISWIEMQNRARCGFLFYPGSRTLQCKGI